MNGVQQQSVSSGTTRSRTGQGWALAACLVLALVPAIVTTLDAIREPLDVATGRADRDRFNPVLTLVRWYVELTPYVALLGLSAAVLRRLGLSIAAIIVGVMHLGGLVLIWIMIILDVSVSVSVLSAAPVAVAATAVLLTTLGAVLTLRDRTRRWSAIVTIGVVVAAVGGLLANPLLQYQSSGAMLPTQTALSVVLVLRPALEVVAIILMGLAVAFRSRIPALFAALALSGSIVIHLVDQSPATAIGLGDLFGHLYVVIYVVALVSLVIAIGLGVGLLVALRRPVAAYGESREIERN
ncbi:hypothetical protein ACQBAR_00255 [Propionibacteriaceae bacterium Y1685]|uniref:hypothetical protein n=1 Tax=Microlunatus sp. Y1700 TaxID=3418487 RepID=UPI003B7E5A8A